MPLKIEIEQKEHIELFKVRAFYSVQVVSFFDNASNTIDLVPVNLN